MSTFWKWLGIFAGIFVAIFVLGLGIGLAVQGDWAAWRVGLLLACIGGPIVTGVTAIIVTSSVYDYGVGSR